MSLNEEREVIVEKLKAVIRGQELMREMLNTKVVGEEALGNNIVEKEAPPEKPTRGILQGIKMFVMGENMKV